MFFLVECGAFYRIELPYMVAQAVKNLPADHVADHTLFTCLTMH